MKFISFSALAALLLTAAHVQADAKSDKVVKQLAGKWEAVDKGQAIAFEFSADGTFSISAAQRTMGGKFTVDASELPWKMDLDVQGPNAKKGYTIFRINENGSLDFIEPAGAEDERPDDFSRKYINFTKSGTPAPAGEPGSIVGKWQGSVERDVITMTFTADGKFTLDEGSGPKEGTYKLDKSVTPHALDLTMKKDGKTLFALCQFVGDKLKVCEPQQTKEKLGKDFGDHDVVLMGRMGASAPPAVDPKLVGKWQGNADDEKIVLEFKADGTFSLQKNGRDGGSGTYSTQPDAAPAQIDLVLAGKTALAIYRIEGERLTMSEPENKRAKNFDAKSVLIAEKVKQ